MSDMTERKRILINDIRIPYGAGNYDEEAILKAESVLRKKTGAAPSSLQIAKKSIDARREITFVYTVYAEISCSEKKLSDPKIKLFSEPELNLTKGNEKLASRPVIIGFGPAGMFAGLLLAREGYRPLILERGADVDARTEAVEKFMRGGSLDVNTNIQFGAGGAGTFSDGKLTTRINDPLIAYVLRTLVELGAPEDIV